MNAPRPLFWACILRAVSPSLLVAGAALAFLVVSVLELGGVTRRAVRVNDAVQVARAHIAAETALQMLTSSARQQAHCTVAGVPLGVRVAEDLCTVTLEGSSVSGTFSARRLRGGAARVFARRRAATNPEALAAIGGGLLETPERWPRVDGELVAAAGRVDELRGFRRDREIALRCFTAGTDRADYVWFGGDDSRSRSLPDGLLVVPGNLWIEAGDRPFEVCLSRDLVLWVQGNLYLLRSLRVTGKGRLLLVTDVASHDVVFADKDFSGGWSTGDVLRRGNQFAGAVEGAGSVYLGLPAHAAQLVCDAGILVGGELHVVSSLDVRGPLLLRRGCTRWATANEHAWADAVDQSLADKSTTRLPVMPSRRDGGWVFHAGRDRVSGFRVIGVARPGRLAFRPR